MNLVDKFNLLISSLLDFYNYLNSQNDFKQFAEKLLSYISDLRKNYDFKNSTTPREYFTKLNNTYRNLYNIYELFLELKDLKVNYQNFQHLLALTKELYSELAKHLSSTNVRYRLKK